MANDSGLHKLALKHLRDGTKLVYYCNGKIYLEGLKESSGIKCLCCNTVVSASRFEAHAGYGSRKKPYSYIYVKSKNVTLNELSILTNGDQEHDQNNDYESVLTNVNDQMDVVQGEQSSGLDAVREDAETQAIKYEDDEECTACVLCGDTKFLVPPEFGPLTIMLCDQCDREYHVDCLKRHGMADLKVKPVSYWFCSVHCRRIYWELKQMCREEAISILNFVDFLKMRRLTTIDSIKLKFVNSTTDKYRSGSLVSDAVDAILDGFPSFADARDQILLLVQGTKEPYRGMRCMVLLVNSRIVTVAVFRVFSKEVAELPLVATIRHRQKEGYFRIMFDYLENLLCLLEVQKIVLPATDGAQSMWQSRFGFWRMNDEDVSRYLKLYPFIIQFPDTLMLAKRIPNPPEQEAGSSQH
ncbi:Increased DNA methylation 1-like protein [Drosera capensis]